MLPDVSSRKKKAESKGRGGKIALKKAVKILARPFESAFFFLLAFGPTIVYGKKSKQQFGERPEKSKKSPEKSPEKSAADVFFYKILYQKRP